ncbi:MAG: crosslink repair DNA glycosylase YcaQ family protein [Gemmatimonadaceae bacterium]
MHQLGLLQVDSVSIVAPAHYQVLFSRLGAYDRALLDDLVYQRREFTEHWAHEACILPVSHWPLLRHRVAPDDRRVKALRQVLRQEASYAERVLASVRERGAISAGEMPEPDGSLARTQGWWGWTMAKTMLERSASSCGSRLALSEWRRHATSWTTIACPSRKAASAYATSLRLAS